MTLVVFDIDGTICDTQEVEGRCFALAVEEMLGVIIDTSDWSAFTDPTSSGIIRELGGESKDEYLVKQRFVVLLEEESREYPGDFSPIRGVSEFVRRVSNDENFEVAIATGGFDTEAAFKLECCRLELDSFPHATSSDASKRLDIIPLAVSSAGYEMNSVVYFGDAPWDIEVCEKLEIPMIGIGRRIEKLRNLGLQEVFRDFDDANAIFEVLLETIESALSRSDLVH